MLMKPLEKKQNLQKNKGRHLQKILLSQLLIAIEY